MGERKKTKKRKREGERKGHGAEMEWTEIEQDEETEK